MTFVVQKQLSISYRFFQIRNNYTPIFNHCRANSRQREWYELFIKMLSAPDVCQSPERIGLPLRLA